MDLEHRSRIHAALGDSHRLAMVDALALGDRTFQELMSAATLPGNLAAHHLNVLEAAGLIERRVSDGDRRRRYISLRTERLDGLLPASLAPSGPILFVCTHNSARSQFAAALWRERTGAEADSAGTEPAPRVHPRAVDAAHGWGLDLSKAVPKGYDAIDSKPEVVISVCDRAHEAAMPFQARTLHWSIPDPVASADRGAFNSAFGAIAERVDRLIASGSTPIKEARS